MVQLWVLDNGFNKEWFLQKQVSPSRRCTIALITNNRSSLYGGVNQQSSEHRQENQVEEMINAIPTINTGLVKRNPTKRQELSEQVDYTSEIWNYEYDRGTAGSNEEQYSISITQSKGLEIVNINTGKVYTADNGGISMSQSAIDYLYPFVSGNGYAATTIKDTTFLVNKSVFPRLKPSVYDPSDTIETRTTYVATLPYYSSPSPSKDGNGNRGMDKYLDKAAPQNALVVYEGHYKTSGLSLNYAKYLGATVEIVVDSMYTVNHIVQSRSQGTTNKSGQGHRFILYPETMSSMMSSLTSRLTATLEATGKYIIDVTSDSIKIEKLDGTAVAINVSVNFPPDIPFGEFWYTGTDRARRMNPIQSDYFGDVIYTTESRTITIPNNSYLSTGFIWVQRASSVSAYTYSATVKTGGTEHRVTGITGDSTSAVASDFATKISAIDSLTAIALGSIVKITTDDEAEIEYVATSDSFGNQASRGFGYTVATMNDLPANMEFDKTIIKVSGTENGVFQTYWVQFDGSVWKETKDPAALSTIDETTMPHRLTRNGDDTFTLETFDQWATRTVGDDDTNKYPSFLSNGKVSPSPIKDIFFFKNRLGFITSTTVSMSEVGKYGNFWRTTVFAILDSDPIDTAVDSNKAIELEYASYLEDSLMLFADKAQFKLSGARILSPKSVQISQTSAYETNRDVRPIFLNDKIFFVVKRGDNSALYEYFISEGTSEKSEAIDVTAHVQTYLPSGITKLSGSPVNNMLFAFAKSTPDTIYVYKYYDTSGDRVQSAWFKWTFNGTIFNAFSFGKYINLLIERKENIAVEDWVVGSGKWDNSKLWDNSKSWVMSPDSLTTKKQFERMEITPQQFTGEYIDDSEIVEDTDNVVALDYKATTLNSGILEKRDLRIIQQQADIEVILYHDITVGSLMLTVYYGTSSSISAVGIVGNTTTKVLIPRNEYENITSISIIPSNTELSEYTLRGLSAFYVGSVDDLIYNDGVKDWYVDGVAISEDPTINPIDYTKLFGSKNLGSKIPTLVSLGEWVMSTRTGGTNTRGHLQFKTAQISSEEGSRFSLVVEDIKRGTLREIDAKYTIGRKPMIYGNAENIRLHIYSNDAIGFNINSVSFEGNYNSRNKKV